MMVSFFQFDKHVLQMLYYSRIHLSKRIDTAKSNNSREFIVCHHWLFFHGFEFRYSVCNVCHGIKMFCLNIGNITIISVKGV